MKHITALKHHNTDKRLSTQKKKTHHFKRMGGISTLHLLFLIILLQAQSSFLRKLINGFQMTSNIYL